MKKFAPINLNKVILPTVLILGLAFLFFIGKNAFGTQAQTNEAVATSSGNLNPNKNAFRQYGNCNYYKAVVERTKKALMKDLSIPDDNSLAKLLEDLKNNPQKRKEFQKNKQYASYNIERLVKGENDNGKKIPSDVDMYLEAVNNPEVCDPKKNKDSVDSVKTNLKVIEILAEGLKSFNLQTDKIDDIWSKEYLERGKKPQN